MLSTKKIKADYKEVPSQFIFEHYLELTEKLVGQEIKMKSLLNPTDTNPSMTVYVDKVTKDYKWKDFSAGKGGNPINLVMELKGLNFNEAANRIVNDYNTYCLNSSVEDNREFKEYAKYKVSRYNIRKWNTNDQNFWTDFYIGTSFLSEYNIQPLSDYSLSKDENGTVNEITIKGEYLYGYFKKNGELYKIYQPKNKDRKYIKVASFIQGSEQLKGYNILIINSGLKDIGAMNSLKLKIDYTAPDSENSPIAKDIIIKWKKKYKYVFVMFDNDEAGIKAMKRYRREYGLPCLLLTVKKDVAESVKSNGPKDIRERVISLIESKIFDLSQK